MKNIKTVKQPAERSKKETENAGDLKIGKVSVKITNRSKLYWPDEGITKGMLIDYYQSIAASYFTFSKGPATIVKKKSKWDKRSTVFFTRMPGKKPLLL